MKRVITMMVLIGLVGSASAATAWFDQVGGTGNDLWSDGGNWNNGIGPLSGVDGVSLYANNGAGGLCQMDTTSTIVALSTAGANATELEITSTGYLIWTTQAWPAFGTRDGRTDILTVNGGTIDVQAGPWLAFGDTGSGVLNMNSGLLKTGNLRIDWDKGASRRGQANMTGGVIDLTGILRVGVNGNLHVTGGMIITRGADDTSMLQWMRGEGLITGITESDIYYDGTDTYVIPEPATLGLFGLMGGGLLWFRKRLSI